MTPVLRKTVMRRQKEGSHGSEMSGVNDIRKSFLDFFARNDHQVVAVVVAGAAQ